MSLHPADIASSTRPHPPATPIPDAPRPTHRRAWRLALPLALAAGVLACLPAQAIVIRHDVPDERHHAPDALYPPLADLPGEGHGVLVAPRWVATAAHAVDGRTPSQLTLGGRPRAVLRVVMHPGYQRLPAALANGPTEALMAFLEASDDIALIELAEPVSDIAPALLNERTDELGQVVELLGKGATGNGQAGQAAGPHRTRLRLATNRISAVVAARWLVYDFSAGAQAEPLEGFLGNGDSGGPVLLQRDGRKVLAGLASWKHWQGDMADFRAGIYGQKGYQLRISHYLPWIRAVTQAP